MGHEEWIELDFEHYGTEIEINMSTNIDDNPNDESWGFRDFEIYTFYEGDDECDFSWGLEGGDDDNKYDCFFDDSFND